MPAASGTPIVGKMSSRVLNMKFMQRGNKTTTETKSTPVEDKQEENQDKKAYVKDVSEWSFASQDKINLIKSLQNKRLKSSVSKKPVSISQTILNEKYFSEDSESNKLVGKKEFGEEKKNIKVVEEAFEKASADEEPKDLAQLFKESNENNNNLKKKRKRNEKYDVEGKDIKKAKK